MRRLTKNTYTEIYYWGCNPSFITTSDGVFMIDAPQQPIDAVRWREKIEEHGKIRYLVNTEPHGDHILGNSYFPGVTVLGQRGMRARYDETVPMMTGDQRFETMKQMDPDSIWLLRHPLYPPNPPTKLFDKDLTIKLGKTTIQCIHHPGHTPVQTSVYLKEEGIIFTGDNIFNGAKTFIQEADPWQWLETLDTINKLDFKILVPGHGEPCDKKYIPAQKQIINDWVGAMEQFRSRGLTLEVALKEPRPKVDPYPIGQRLFGTIGQDNLDVRIITNLYKQLDLRDQGKIGSKAAASKPAAKKTATARRK